MSSASFCTKVTATAMLALGMLFSTGCTKEEVIAPNGLFPEVRRTAPVPPAPPTDHGQVNGTNSRGDNGVFITDDGDDLGDKERTHKPKLN
ncbi:MAG: hypothetical protein WAT41_15080 [Flavobacteriales bacterium]